MSVPSPKFGNWLLDGDAATPVWAFAGPENAIKIAKNAIHIKANNARFTGTLADIEGLKGFKTKLTHEKGGLGLNVQVKA